jgi:DNA-binding transcriptional regulator YiaG
MTADEIKRVSLMRQLAATGEAKRIRERSRIGLRELASWINVQPKALHRWESGNVRPTGESALRWAEAIEKLSELAEAAP